MKLNKKGVAIVFDWIFSIVAGVLIFSFLIYFAVQHTDLFGKVTARVVAEELDVLFSGYETTQTRSVLDLGKKVELGFSCDDKNLKQKFTINNMEGKTMWGKVIFAPKKIESDKINVATASWNVPFRVANFIYLWDKKYVLTGDIPNINLLDNFKKDPTGTTGNIRFAVDPSLSYSQYTGDCPPYFASQHEKIIYYLKDSGKSDDYFGYVCFKDGERSFFYGEAMMIGAVFSESKGDFECIKSIAVDRLRIVNEVYREKKNEIIPLDIRCEGDYNSAIYDTNTMRDLESLGFNDVRRVERANEKLIREGCAGVY